MSTCAVPWPVMVATPPCTAPPCGFASATRDPAASSAHATKSSALRVQLRWGAIGRDFRSARIEPHGDGARLVLGGDRHAVRLHDACGLEERLVVRRVARRLREPVRLHLSVPGTAELELGRAEVHLGLA